MDSRAVVHSRGSRASLGGVVRLRSGLVRGFRLSGAVLLVVASMTVSACTSGSGGGASTVSPSPSAFTSTPPLVQTTIVRPTPTTSPAPSLPPVPAAAMEQTPEGAVAFLLWWVEMYNYVELTGQTDLISQYSEPGCTFCTNFIKRITPVYDSGGRIERDGATLFTNLIADSVDVNGYTVVNFEGTSPTTRTLDNKAQVVSEAPPEPGPRPSTAGLQWVTAGWVVTDIGNRGGS